MKISIGSLSIAVSVFLVMGCATPRHLCSQGGEPAHTPSAEGKSRFQGTKKCTQIFDSASGGFVNDGKYYEWFPNEKIRVTGEYRLGKKSGRWIEYSEAGQKISDQYFENGKEVSAP
jgi:hypothetical protein